MEILYLLIPLGILILGMAIGAFIWAVKSGQFEDLQGPAHRILMDDDDPLIPKNLRQKRGQNLDQNLDQNLTGQQQHRQKTENSDEKASKS